jgi:Icc-related predicted phosphoesterase
MCCNAVVTFEAEETGPRDEPTALERVFSLIPADLDVLVCHSPPYGYGDRAFSLGSRVDWPGGEGRVHLGSRALLPALDRAQPRLVVYGHIHEDHGQWRRGERARGCEPR